MKTHPNSVPFRHNVTKHIFEDEILTRGEPVILKGLVADWPIVQAAQKSRNDLGSYLKQHDSGVAVETFVGQPEMQGRYFYNQDMNGFNYDKGRNDAFPYRRSIAVDGRRSSSPDDLCWFCTFWRDDAGLQHRKPHAALERRNRTPLMAGQHIQSCRAL